MASTSSSSPLVDAGRLFSHLDEDQLEISNRSTSEKEFQSILETIRISIIGADDGFLSPYGLRPIVYADYIASGRALRFIEDYIQNEVLPLYGNTHTSSSVTGIQTTLFRNEARDIIKRSVNASKDDVVIFTGSGATSPLNSLVHLLNVGPEHLIITGPYEHHSNLLPWRESGATVISIRESSDHGVDLNHLERVLEAHQHIQYKIGTFSAASNITGILTDTNAVSEVLHRYGALSIWDMACSAPYSKVDMNPDHDPRYQKHAAIISPHKLMGAVSSPGILIVKAQLLRNRVPCRPGGGTVFFVTSHRHRYLSNFVEREEGGTPDIIGSIRAALAFDLRNALNIDRIASVEDDICQYVWNRWSSTPNLVILGDRRASRLPIFSFIIRSPIGSLYLHYNFVSSLLNDLFGIQTRGGCACAGPYALRLLGIDDPTADRFERALLDKIEVLRPGFVRLNFAYFETRESIEYICAAVEFVSEHGWRFIPDYVYLDDTGEWRHRSVVTHAKDRRWLGHISYQSGTFSYTTGRRLVSRQNLGQYVRQAREIMDQTVSSYSRYLPDTSQVLSESHQSLRWFITPFEALQILQGSSVSSLLSHISCPINPNRYHQLIIEKNDSEPIIPICMMSSSSDTGSDNNRDTISRSTSGSCPMQCHNTCPPCANCYHSHEPGSAQCLSCPCIDYRPISSTFTSRSSSSSATATTSSSLSEAEAGTGTTGTGISNNPTSLINNKKLTRHLLDRLVQKTTKAISEFNMFDCHRPQSQPDRLLVAVSGGKDSLTLVDILLEIRRRAPFKFEIGACTVDPMTPEYDPSPLRKYFQTLGIPYYYQQQPIIESAKTCMRRDSNNRASICSFCARMKRGILYSTARKHGYNILCMGQHLDDLAESFLMSAFHNGACRTMKANYHVAEGDIRVIRPLCLIRERQTREYASVAQLPVIFENCPACFEAPKERQRIKVLLASQEHIHPNLFSSLLRSMKPLMRRENSVYTGPDRREDDEGNDM